jgi:hypothetical protein
MPIPDLDHALSAATRAVDLGVQHVLNHQPTHVATKGDRDLVTNIDVAVEHLIRGLLHDWDPTVGFLGEEHGAFGDEHTYWVLDPIDGTINFAHGGPLCAIALGLVHDHQPVLGGTVVSYSSTTGAAPTPALGDLIYRELMFRGFWLINWLRNAPREEIEQTYAELAELVSEGVLSTAVEATYALEDYQAAFDHARKAERSGKVIFTFPAA